MFHEDFMNYWRRLMEQMEKEMQKLLEEQEEGREGFREEELPDGSRIKIWGPYIYGYSITVGPNGEIKKREFGNVKSRRYIEETSEPEPLIDIIDGEDEYKIIMEMPGVDEEDIEIKVSEGKLTINAKSSYKNYHKELDLPKNVNTKDIKKRYKNGVLEIGLRKRINDPNVI
ncbi:MAG: archaeal heat shock protein Hsp20 [Candidatus Methanomethylicia archaeon]